VRPAPAGVEAVSGGAETAAGLTTFCSPACGAFGVAAGSIRAYPAWPGYPLEAG